LSSRGPSAEAIHSARTAARRRPALVNGQLQLRKQIKHLALRRRMRAGWAFTEDLLVEDIEYGQSGRKKLPVHRTLGATLDVSECPSQPQLTDARTNQPAQ